MTDIKTIELDIETYSDRDIKNGVYRYVESPDFDILLMTVFINGEPYAVYDIASGDVVPDEIIQAIVSDDVIKWAHNASFERICLSIWINKNYPQYFHSYGDSEDTVGKYLNPVSWRCSMILAAYNGLPLSLESVGQVLGLEQQKLKSGKEGIRLFCKPVKPTKANGMRTRNFPSDYPEKWEDFKKYNYFDVVVEMSAIKRLEKYPVPDFVWEEYHMSEKINDRGILIDSVVVANAIKLDNISHNKLAQEMIDKTGLENPNSPVQLKKWLKAKGFDVESLGK
ncbi:MAG: DNA-directed DNA polymerase, partial [Eubacterium sp.]|nr:DNA-directed DNA polymerase [Eubacterium sp.]